MKSVVRTGTAGWTLPRQSREQFAPGGSQLERYATRFSGVEINSSFYRQHKRTTYERWAASVPSDFRFAVKLPRAITHDQRLVACDVLLDVFLDEVAGLGQRLGPLLVQLPPSLALDLPHAEEFLGHLRNAHPGDVVCEPRHASWFSRKADQLLAAFRVARAGADPACVPAAIEPASFGKPQYWRLHGSPRMYWSSYEPAWLGALAEQLVSRRTDGVEQWVMFDNTTLGFATANALELSAMLA